MQINKWYFSYLPAVHYFASAVLVTDIRGDKVFFVVFFYFFMYYKNYQCLLSPLKFSFKIHRSAIGRFKCQVKIVSNLSNSTMRD